MSEIIYIFMAVITFFVSLFPSPVLQRQKTDGFVPTVRLMACSDTHISGPEDPKLDRIKKAIGFCRETAEADANYKKLDAVMFVGDVTDNGKDEQFSAFESAVKSSIGDGTNILAVAAKSHDSSTNGKKSTQWIEKITGNKSDFHVVINGFHFIGLSTSTTEGVNYVPSQRTWLEKQLKEATADSPDKPIFVCHHEHVSGTVYGSENWGTAYFKDIFARYPMVVHFSGHSHYPLNDVRSVWQGAFTAVGTSSMYYMEFKIDGVEPIHPEGNGEAAQAWIVEADANGRVRLRGFDVLSGAFQCDYLIECPADRATNVFAPKNLKTLSSAPVFGENAAVTAEPSDGKYVITFPAAESTDGCPVFLYRYTVFNKAGKKTDSGYVVNNYWSINTFKTVKMTVEAESGYSVEVTAENSYGMRSGALKYTFA